MPNYCIAETFDVIVCYSYLDQSQAEELTNLQNLCDDANLQTFTCTNNLNHLAPIAISHI